MPAGDPPLTFADLAALDLARLKGLGEKGEKALAGVDVHDVLELLTYYPIRYIDRTREAPLSEVAVGEEATMLVEVSSVRAVWKGRRRVEAVVRDPNDPRHRMAVTWFHQMWRERQLQPGREVLLYGKVEQFRGRRRMTNPVVDLLGDKTGRIIPVYPQSEKHRLSTWDVAKWVTEALARSADRGIADPVPSGVTRRHDFVDRHRAFTQIHLPETMSEMHEARRRLVFDELLRVQLALVHRKRLLERSAVGIAHDLDGAHTRRLLDSLPFEPTGAQYQAFDELGADLSRPVPMHRLLQGDVGAGKTLVALWAMLVAVQSGHQGALMAPTEVLAEQHHSSLCRFLAEVTVAEEGSLFEQPLDVALLTGRTPAAERRELLAGLGDGSVPLVVGTHALIQEGVDFASLGVVVVDEQHRFGVEQRDLLRSKGDGERVPDVLVMTATPIPRTAAMTVYGDLDVTVLDELPPGRTPIQTTRARTDAEVAEVWAAVRDAVTGGRQAYVVCPLVEESDKLQVASAEETHAELSAGPLAGLTVGLVHGRLSGADKEAVMGRFRAGRLDVLVATTVIEVGVDVPNATVMVVLDADRFGIAQLHQLRGRVGRAEHESRCFLVSASDSPEAEQRLGALVRTTDGFALAEVDLELRGEGTIMGARQKGRNELKLASLRRDKDWVVAARESAFTIVDELGGLAAHPQLADEVTRFIDDADAEFLLKS